MPRTIETQSHEKLREFVVEKRKAAGLTQHQLAAKLKRSQSFVATIETGQRRIDVVELLELGRVLKFDPHEAIRHLEK
jgi:ribosome-binding protein aMBF1 (putative translation factor)